MTNKLEKTFFDTFGIKPKKQCYYWDCPYSTGDVVKDTPMNERDCNSCKNPNKEIYPQITDRILLELIFLQPLSIEFKYPRNIEELKNTLFGYYIEELSLFAEPSEAEIFKHQVRALFEDCE